METDLPRIAPPGLTTGRPQNHSRQTRAAISREAVKQAEQLAEELTGDGFSEQVSDHTRARQMLNHNRLAGNKVTKILGGPHDVLSLLEAHRVIRHFDCRLGVADDDDDDDGI